MNRLPIRLRLTMVFAVAMAVVLGLAGWLVYTQVAGSLDRALDQQLRSRAQDVSALVRRGGSLKSTSGTLIEHGESFSELLTPAGTVIDSTATVRTNRLLDPATLERAARRTTFFDERALPGLDEPARLLALPVQRGNQRLILVVGATRENRTE